MSNSMVKEAEQRRSFNRAMSASVKRRGLLSTPARQWVEQMMRHNIEQINEIEDAQRAERRKKFRLFP